MPHASRQLAIQLGLIVFCVLFVMFTRSGVSVSSQVSTCVTPPHYPGYPPPKLSWPQNTIVTVKIDAAWTNEAKELDNLQDLGLQSIELAYKESKKTDLHGNQFRYRGKVTDVHGAQLGRWAWDVYLVNAP